MNNKFGKEENDVLDRIIESRRSIILLKKEKSDKEMIEA